MTGTPRGTEFIVHLRKPAAADLAATARIIDTEAERRRVPPHIARNWGRDDLEVMIRQSPLIEVSIHPETSPTRLGRRLLR